LLMSCVLYFRESYQFGFAVLLIPALCSLSTLAASCYLYPRPQDLEKSKENVQFKGFSKTFWLYMCGVSCVAAGYIDFALIAYHFIKVGQIPSVWIPIFFSIAMMGAVIASLVLGRLFDLKGVAVIIFATVISSLFVPLVFMDGFVFGLVGMILWGIGLGSQESIISAFIGNIVPMDRRGTGYGVLHLGFGIFWFLGSALMGYLYDISLPALIIFSVVIQWCAIPFFIAVKNSESPTPV
jgi:MFS family permease